jgi:hypothetical protein
LISQGYYRRGSAYLGMLKFDTGLKDFRRVAKLRPRDADAQKKLRTCETEVQKIRFQAAISSSADEGPPVSESVDPTSYCTSFSAALCSSAARALSGVSRAERREL